MSQDRTLAVHTEGKRGLGDTARGRIRTPALTCRSYGLWKSSVAPAVNLHPKASQDDLEVPCPR